MKIIMTGKTGVGKTEILNAIGFENSLIVDDLVKNVFYKHDHPAFKEVVELFGDDIVKGDFINAKLLGEKVLRSKRKMKKLSWIVLPYIQNHIAQLKGDWLIELAVYINYEKWFKILVDKVVLVTRKKKLTTYPFSYLKGRKVKLIKNKKIAYDLKIENNLELADAAESLKLILQHTWIKHI